MDTSSSDTEDPSTPLLGTPLADDDDDHEGDPFEVLARVTPSPDTVPWEQRSTTMKVVHVADRVFLSFLGLFFLVLMGEVLYIVYRTVPWEMIFRALIDRLLMQEEGEEDLDL